MPYPPLLEIGLSGLPADIVGGFSSSYFGMRKDESIGGLKYRDLDFIVERNPVRARIFDLGPLSELEEGPDSLPYVGYIMIFRSDYADSGIDSPFFKGIRKKGVPTLVIGIDYDISTMDFYEVPLLDFDLCKALKYLISDAINFKGVKGYKGNLYATSVSHDEFLSKSISFYKILMEQAENRRKIEGILRELGVSNTSLSEIPDPSRFENMFKKGLSRFEYLKVSEIVDEIKAVVGRYREGKISKEHTLAIMNNQIKKVIDRLLKYI